MTFSNFLKLGAVLLFFLLLIFFGSGEASKKIKGGMFWVVSPLLRVANSVSMRLGAFGGLSQDEARNILLENQRLKAKIFEIEELKDQNVQLRAALGLKESVGLPIEGAGVLLHTREFGQEFLVIDKGKNVGIKKDNLVIDANRLLVGSIVAVEDRTAKVGVVSNAGKTYEAELVPLGVKMLVRGMSGRALLLELLPPSAPIRKGDFVALALASGHQTFLIGEVVREKAGSNTTFKEAVATMLVHPETLSEVFVLVQ